MAGKNLAAPNDERYSKNGAKYVTFDFANVTEKGLKKLITAFEKNDCVVANVDAANRTTKKDGLATKKAVFTFENGQSVTITLGDQGDVIETRLNATVLPVKDLSTVEKYAKEVAGKVAANQQRFDDSLAKKAKKVIDTSDKKPASKTILGRIMEAKSAQTTAQENVNRLKSAIATAQNSKTDADSKLSALKKELDVERETTNRLIEEIEHLGGTAE